MGAVVPWQGIAETKRPCAAAGGRFWVSLGASVDKGVSCAEGTLFGGERMF